MPISALPLLAAAGIAVAILALGDPVEAQGAPPAIPVTVAYPIPRTVTQWDEYSGRFVAMESVEVRPRVSGFIDKVDFRDGQMVRAGDLLFTIDKRPFEIAVEAARAEIARARAQVELGQNEVERATPLVRSGAVTQRDLEQRQANLNVAVASQQAAEAAMDGSIRPVSFPPLERRIGP
jgi:multidrug efflux system membrane fusion protein